VVESATYDLFTNEPFREVADAIPTGLWRISASFEQDWANKHWLEFTGGRLEEEVNFGWVDKVHPDDRERVLEEFDRGFDAREATRLEYRVQGKDGAYRWFLDAGAPVYRRGEFAGFVGTCADISELKWAEAHMEILQAELIQRSGAEAAMLSSSVMMHEVNQPLMAISAYADALQDLVAGRADLAPEFAEAAASIGREAERARELVRNCKPIVSHERAEKQRENVSSVLRSVEPLIRMHPAAATVRLDWNLAPDLLARISITQIQQVLLNLAVNGLQSMRDMPHQVLSISAAKWGDAAVVSVADRGVGIPSAEREQIFGPGMSGKASGTGLGLYLCRLIVTDHGGRVWAEENPEGGSIFRFKIPLELA
jgi:PAS domain S-box-containing protein